MLKKHTDSTKKFFETDIFIMLKFLIDNIFAIFGGRGSQKRVGIPMSTNCTLLVADLFLYCQEADFAQGLLKKNEKNLSRSFNFTFRYINVIISLNDSTFVDFADGIQSIELEIKNSTYIANSVSYINIYLEIESDGRLRIKLYDKRQDFIFPMVN